MLQFWRVSFDTFATIDIFLHESNVKGFNILTTEMRQIYRSEAFLLEKLWETWSKWIIYYLEINEIFALLYV